MAGKPNENGKMALNLSCAYSKPKESRMCLVYYYFRREAVWQSLLHSLYPLARRKAGRREAPWSCDHGLARAENHAATNATGSQCESEGNN